MKLLSDLAWQPALTIFTLPETLPLYGYATAAWAVTGSIASTIFNSYPNIRKFDDCDPNLLDREITCFYEFLQDTGSDAYKGALYGAAIGASVVFIFTQVHIYNNIREENSKSE